MELCLIQTLSTHLSAYMMIMFHNTIKHQNDARKNNNTVEGQNHTRMTRMTLKSIERADKVWEKISRNYRLIITISNYRISANIYLDYILKDPNITNDICNKCREKPESTLRAPAEGDYTPIVKVK